MSLLKIPVKMESGGGGLQKGSDLRCELPIHLKGWESNGWTCKANFSDDYPIHLKLSRHLASLTLDNNICLFRQHIKGLDNAISESLSRDFHLADAFLFHFLSCLYPKNIPHSFNLCPLPSVITSYIIVILDAAPAPPR